MSFIERFFKKKPEEVKVEDVQKFIDRKIEENVNLDYKRISIINDIEKLAKHVSAFANTDGGLVILGVSEETRLRGKKTMRIYPGEITWVDHQCIRERLEKTLNANIDPSVPLRIVPIRKSREEPKVIFLLDVPRTNELHMHKKTQCFYKRLNFESVPMERSDVIGFIKIRLSYERCAWFRLNLDYALLEFMDNILIGLNPDYLKIREFDHKKITKAFEDFLKIPVERVIDKIKHVKIRELVKIEKDLSYFVRDLQKINKYPHDDITPEERVLFDSLREDAIIWRRSWDKGNYYAEEAKWGKIEAINWTDLSYLEFAEAVKDEEYLLRRLQGLVRPFMYFLKHVMNLKRILDDLKQKYGEFKSCKVIQERYEWLKPKR